MFRSLVGPALLAFSCSVATSVASQEAWPVPRQAFGVTGMPRNAPVTRELMREEIARCEAERAASKIDCVNLYIVYALILEQNGDRDLSDAVRRKALTASAEAQPFPNETYHMVLTFVVQGLVLQNRLNEAIDMLEKNEATLEYAEKRGEHHLAELYGDATYRLHDYGEALKRYRQAFAIIQTAESPDPGDYGDLLNSLATALSQNRLFDESDRYFRLYVDFVLREYPDEPAAWYTAYNNAAANMMWSGQHEKAIEYFTRALEILETLARGRRGALDQMIAVAHHNLGSAYTETGQLEEGERYLRMAGDYRFNRSDEDLWESSLTLYALGENLLAQQRLPEAEDMFLRAVAMRRRLPDISPYDRLLSTLALAQVLRRQDKQAPLQYTLLKSGRDDARTILGSFAEFSSTARDVFASLSPIFVETVAVNWELDQANRD